MIITLLDGILIGVMLISAVLAMVRGFSREVLSVASWIAAAAAAFFLFEPLTPYVQNYIDNDTLAMAVAALTVFLVTLLVVSFITLRIADFIIDSRIGALDRTLGFLFGAVRGLLLVVVAILFFNWLSPQNQPEWVADAKSKPFLDDLGQQLVALLPENPEEVLLESLGERPAGEVGEAAPAEGVADPAPAEGTADPAPAEEGEEPADEPAPAPAD